MISRKLMHAILFTPVNDAGRWGVPALFWGEPGIGKTDVIESIGAAWGMPTDTLSPGERGEGAFGVTPVPSRDCEYMTYPPPDWKKKFDEAGRGVLFVDEINTASPALQPPILGLVQARRIGGAYLGDGVRILGAANPPEVAAGGWDLAPPVANRFAHFEWNCPSVAEWSDWLFGNTTTEDYGGDAEREERRVLGEWSTPWSIMRGLVAGFLRRRPEFIHKRPNVGDPNASRAWPSPRSWSFATRALTAAVIHRLEADDAELYLRACVGEGAGNEFVRWRAEADLPDPIEVLDGKVEFKHDPARLDRTMAVLASCAALVAPIDFPKREKRAGTLWTILGTVVEGAADIAIGPAKQLVAARLDDVGKTSNTVMGRLFPVMKGVARP